MENLITKELKGAKQFYITTKEKDGVEIAELTSRNTFYIVRLHSFSSLMRSRKRNSTL